MKRIHLALVSLGTVMLVTGANGSTLTLTASPDGVHVQLVVDEDGAGATAPVGLADTTWAAI